MRGRVFGEDVRQAIQQNAEAQRVTDSRTRKHTYATVTGGGLHRMVIHTQIGDARTIEDAFHVQCEQTIPALFSKAVCNESIRIGRKRCGAHLSYGAPQLMPELFTRIWTLLSRSFMEAARLSHPALVCRRPSHFQCAVTLTLPWPHTP